MPSSINNSNLTNQLEDVLRSFVKEKLELIMREELTNFLHVEQPDASNSRNGYYQRSLETRYGKIENLTVPRDREGAFQTAPASQKMAIGTFWASTWVDKKVRQVGVIFCLICTIVLFIRFCWVCLMD